MPSMANITIKASNGTTDVVFVAKSPSAGDKVPARWSADAASTIPAFRPVVSIVSRDNGNRTARTFVMTTKFPVVETENGVQVIKGYVPFQISGVLPTNLDAAKVKEAIYQTGNLFVSTLIRGSFEDGYAPT